MKYSPSHMRLSSPSAAGNGVGSQLAQTAIGGRDVFQNYSIAVKGAGGSPTAWNVTLQVSNDDSNWTTIDTHTQADGSGACRFVTGKPAAFVRANVVSATLNGATGLTITIIAV
jgi:hypothetical protein